MLSAAEEDGRISAEGRMRGCWATHAYPVSILQELLIGRHRHTQRSERGTDPDPLAPVIGPVAKPRVHLRIRPAEWHVAPANVRDEHACDLSARLLLALLEECNSGASNDREAYSAWGAVRLAVPSPLRALLRVQSADAIWRARHFPLAVVGGAARRAAEELLVGVDRLGAARIRLLPGAAGGGAGCEHVLAVAFASALSRPAWAVLGVAVLAEREALHVPGDEGTPGAVRLLQCRAVPSGGAV